MYRTDTDLNTLEADLRRSIEATEEMGFHETASAMRDVLEELVRPTNAGVKREY